MALTPGRPHEPTLHPRTKEEASEYAMRNRGTSDWYRHDGKNVEQAPAPAARLTTKNAEDIAEKNKGQADQWYQHDHEVAPPDSQPATRCPTAESRQCQEKIYGKDEAWYKHEENQDYDTPRNHVERLPEYGASKSFKVKFTKPDTMDWYKHAEGGGSPGAVTPPPKPKKSHMSPTQPAPPPPTWYGHKPEEGAEDQGNPAHPRMTHPDAETYLQRNHGSATNWFGHDNAPAAQECHSPRVASKEGGEIAKRYGRESENWFDYDANKDYREPRPEGKGNQQARDMIQKSRGEQMGDVMTREATSPDAKPEPRVKPEAQDIAEKNKQGLMDKYLQENKDYNSARPNPRIKAEASDAAEKNKGVMGDCMGGYPDPPADHNARRVKTDAEDNAARNRGTMDKVMGGEGSPVERQNQARAVRPEAQKYADRNKASNMFGDMQISTDAPARGRAQANKNHSSMSGIMGFSG